MTLPPPPPNEAKLIKQGAPLPVPHSCTAVLPHDALHDSVWQCSCGLYYQWDEYAYDSGGFAYECWNRCDAIGRRLTQVRIKDGWFKSHYEWKVKE